MESYMMIFKVRGRRRRHVVQRDAAPVEPCGSFSGQLVLTVENLWKSSLRPFMFAISLAFFPLLCGCVCFICLFEVSPSTANVPADAG